MIEKQTLSTRLIKRAANLLTFSPSTDKADYPWIPFYYFRMIDDIKTRLETSAYASVEEATVDLQALVAVVEAKQAKIDEIMLEYCPEHMTEDQLKEWAKHQHPVELSDALGLD